MGALHLQCPDFRPFPISSAHCHWLVEHAHIEYPELEEKAIMDENKADTLMRFLMLLQVTWFTVQVIARGIKRISITTLELSTLAFACCTLHAIWFWRDKSLDVTQPIQMVSNIELRAIIGAAGLSARGGRRCESTPLLGHARVTFLRRPFLLCHEHCDQPGTKDASTASHVLWE